MKSFESSTIHPSCPVCQGSFKLSFTAKVLGKYNVRYYKCDDCGLMQTESPYWLDEAYNSAITDLDVGLVHRNISVSGTVSKVLDMYFDPCGKYLDFAGGYGLFVRLMRDKGFDFYRHDKYCENIFAKYFEIPSLLNGTLRFELITAIEVLEHVDDPIGELEILFKITDTVLFTTELLPSGILTVDDWWYFVPETGQHITFYTERSFRQLADRLSVNYYTDGAFYHLLTRDQTMKFSFIIPEHPGLFKKMRRLLSEKLALPPKKNMGNEFVTINNDFEYIKSTIYQK